MILVVGDSMLDRYWECSVDRISPEAPVPIAAVKRTYARAGGAANVALNIKSLGSPVSIISAIGRDEAGEELRRLLSGVKVQGFGNSTTQKIRVVSKHQQLHRIDFDERPGQLELSAIDRAYRERDASVVVFSDYGKGALTNVSRMIREAECRTLVDPKGTEWAKYKGAFLLKPNESELRAVVGSWSDPSEFKDKCIALRESLNLGHLLVTLGERGMIDFSDDGIYSIRDDEREVFDVTGAGDTVLAVMAHALHEGMEYREAMRLANKAAGIVVGKFGTATVSREELY
jgi:D-glycero-beta-D-manno-heptose-7-phosphate kinase